MGVGAWFQSILMRTDAFDSVIGTLRKIARESDVKFLAGPPVNGWVSVFPSVVNAPAELLAQRTCCDVFHLQVHDDDVFSYDFYREGKLLDHYVSKPEYFAEDDGRQISEKDKAMSAGKPELFHELLRDSNVLERLKTLLRRNRNFTFESERMSQFVGLLDLENALSSYDYLQSGETENIEGWERFVHIEERPETAEEYFQRGIGKHSAQDYTGAVEELNQALLLKPDMLEAYIERARVREDLRLIAQAWEVHRRERESVAGRSMTTEVPDSVGSAQENLEAALLDYDRAIALEPRQPDALIARARLRRQIGDLEGAIHDYNRIIELRPNTALTYSHRGQVKRKKGDLTGAISDYNRAIELNPSDASFYNNRGLARKHLGDVAAALADLERAIELDPKLGVAYANRAEVRQAQKDVKGALADLDKAIALNPESGRLFNKRAVFKQSTGDAVGALQDCNKAIELEPDLAEAYMNRGAVKLAKKEGAEAAADFSRAIELMPGSANAYASRAETYRRLGKWDEAIARLHQGTGINAGYVGGNLHSGRSEIREG